jgi:hypothetical protein
MRKKVNHEELIKVSKEAFDLALELGATNENLYEMAIEVQKDFDFQDEFDKEVIKEREANKNFGKKGGGILQGFDYKKVKPAKPVAIIKGKLGRRVVMVTMYDDPARNIELIKNSKFPHTLEEIKSAIKNGKTIDRIKYSYKKLDYKTFNQDSRGIIREIEAKTSGKLIIPKKERTQKEKTFIYLWKLGVDVRVRGNKDDLDINGNKISFSYETLEELDFVTVDGQEAKLVGFTNYGHTPLVRINNRIVTIQQDEIDFSNNTDKYNRENEVQYESTLNSEWFTEWTYWD